MRRTTPFAVILAVSVAFSARAAERPFQFPDAARQQSQDLQDRKSRRLNADDQRAVRSICDAGCAARTPSGQPKDPFAPLPDYTDEPGPALPRIDDPEP